MPLTIKRGAFKYKKANGTYDEIHAVGRDGNDVTDVQVAGTSVVQDGVANIPVWDGSTTPGGTPVSYLVATSTAGIAGQILGLDSNLAPVWQDRDRVVTVSGTTPTINAQPGVRYVCGEVTTLDITLPASGCIDVTFESGSTATVLTITPPTGVTLKWANGFNPSSLEANMTYEINIADGLGVAASWT